MSEGQTRFQYMRANWKMAVHLLFSTYRFGVNNQWWSQDDSMFGKRWYQLTPNQIIRNYRGMRFRAIGCYFIDRETAKNVFPRYMKKYHPNDEVLPKDL